MATLDEQIQTLRDQLASDQPPQLPQLPRGSPDDGTRPGWLGLLGEALGGGQSPTYRLRGREEDAAGSRALLNFGINMLLASGPQRVRPDLLSAAASGLQGAQQSLDLDQRRAQAVAQQDYTQRMELAKLGVEQNRDRIERLKAGLSLLQLQGRSQPLPGDTSATTGTTGGGAPGGGYGDQLTGNIEHDEPIIRQRESGGDPKALNYVARSDPSMRAKGATASGLYGFTDTTWKDGLQMIGGDAGKYPTAQSAPEEVQKQVFQAVYKARGTAPWDSRAWGQNWQKQPDGSYALVATPKGAAARTGGTDVAGPPGTVPVRTPSPAPPEATPVASAAVEPETGLPVVTGPGATPSTPATPAGSAPGSLEAYLQEHAAHLVPDEATRASFAIEPDRAQLANLAAARRQAETALRDQYTLQRQGDPKADVQGARLKLTDVEEKESDLRRAASDKGRELEKTWREARRKELFDAWTAQNAAITGETKAQADHRRQLELEETRRQNTAISNQQSSDLQLARDQIGKINESANGARRNLAQVEQIQAMSDLIGPGTEGILATQINGRPLAAFLQQYGIGPEQLRTKAGAVLAFKSLTDRFITDMRAGQGLGPQSDRDLAQAQGWVVNAGMEGPTRNAMLALMRETYLRQVRYASLVQKYHAGGMKVGEAEDRADQELGPAVPRMDRNITADSPRWGQWLTEHNVQPNTFYRDPDGRMRIYKGGQ